MQCTVCKASNLETLISIPRKKSLTSLCTLVEGDCTTYMCTNCSHAQSPELGDSAAFYAEDYDILVNSEEEDQIYEVRDETPVFRFQHQAETLLRLTNPTMNASVLDWGSAKAATLRIALGLRPDLDVHVFDVSDRYQSFWTSFLQPSKTASFQTPKSWVEKFELVTSFFVMEHITDIDASAQQVHSLLSEGGCWYIIVPDPLQNSGDLVVVDHVQHFTPPSLQRFLEENGFVVEEISTTAHAQALVAIAHKKPKQKMTEHLIEATINQLRESGRFWNDYAQKVQRMESEIAGDFAIYGAGFYGSLIYSLLDMPHRVKIFIDQNKHLRGQSRFGIPIAHPSALPPKIEDVVVGQNPDRAHAIFNSVATWPHSPPRPWFV